MKPPTTLSIRCWLAASLLAAVASAAVGAAELYRWIEADGSITFSPNQPPAGVQFERVGEASAGGDGTVSSPVGNSPVSDSDAPVRAAQPGQAAQQAPSAADPPSAGSDGSAQRRPEAGLSYAPPPIGAASNAPSDRVSRAGADPESAVPVPDNAPRRSARTSDAGSQRAERCRELAKRVVSLERRLSTPLSAQDMDNTVLYMARYQQNVDQHCRE